MTMMGAVGVITLSGVIAGGTTYSLFYSGSNGQGIVGDAWDAIIRYDFYLFDLYFAMYELMEGDQEDSKSTDRPAKRADPEYAKYKDFCENPPKRNHFNKKTGGCDFLKERKKHAEKCLKMVKSFDATRPNSDHSKKDSWIPRMEGGEE